MTALCPNQGSRPSPATSAILDGSFLGPSGSPPCWACSQLRHCKPFRCGLSYSPKGFISETCTSEPKALGLVGLPGTRCHFRPGLSSSVASCLRCGTDWASPPPLSWAPLAGNRRPRLTLTYSLSSELAPLQEGGHLYPRGMERKQW